MPWFDFLNSSSTVKCQLCSSPLCVKEYFPSPIITHITEKQKHLGWPFWSLFGSLWSVYKPAIFGHFWSKMDHYWARDDLVKLSWKSDAGKCQNQVTHLSLTNWVKGTSPFGRCWAKNPYSFVHLIFSPYIHFRSISLQYVVDEFRRFCWNAANSSDLCINLHHKESCTLLHI